MSSISINYYGLLCGFDIKLGLYEKLVKNYFTGYTNFTTKQLVDQTIQVEISSEECPRYSGVVLSDKFLKTKDGLLVTHQYLSTTTKVFFKIHNSSLSRINIYFSNNTIFSLANILTFNKLKTQLFRQIIKYYLEQSFLWSITQQKNLLCLHASAVSRNRKSFLFVGSNGVGKSTLSQFLVKNYGYELLADNYILTSNNTAYLAPDTVRLSNQSMSWLGLMSSETFGFGKNVINHKYADKEKESKISKIFITQRDKQWGIEKLSLKSAISIIEQSQIIGKDHVRFAPICMATTAKNITDKMWPQVDYYLLSIGPLSDFPDSILE